VASTAVFRNYPMFFAPCARLMQPLFHHGLVALAAAWLLLATAAQGQPLDPPDFSVPEFAPQPGAAGVGGLVLPARPDWTSYALTDALYWGRDNRSGNRPLVISQDTETPLVSSRDLQFPWAAGVRAFYGQRAPDQGGWELGYFGVYGFAASQTVAAPPGEFLQMPFPLGPELTADGENATVRYTSLVNSAEANLFSTSTQWRDRSGSWLTVDWLAGFRYIGVEESAGIDIECCFVDDTFVTVPYRVRTRNNLFGGQLGSRARWTWERWAFEGWAKAGLFGNAQQALQSQIVNFELEPLTDRPAFSRRAGSVAFVGDINTSVVYRLTDVWGIRAGYNLIWIEGLALAPDQFNFGAVDSAAIGVASGGGMFLHGANLGLEARW